MATPMIGEIRLFAGNFPPRNWAFCNELLSISQNTALFSILGTTYGGDGRTTFALPDLRSRVPIHAGQGPGLSNYNLGQQAGVENVSLTQNQLRAHSHGVNAVAQGGNQASPVGNLPAVESTGTSLDYSHQGPGRQQGIFRHAIRPPCQPVSGRGPEYPARDPAGFLQKTAPAARALPGRTGGRRPPNPGVPDAGVSVGRAGGRQAAVLR